MGNDPRVNNIDVYGFDTGPSLSVLQKQLVVGENLFTVVR